MFDADDEDAAREAKASAAPTTGEDGSAALPEAPPIEFEYRESKPLVSQSGTAPGFNHLRDLGIDLPPPGSLDDAAISSKLDQIERAVSGGRDVFLKQTDHLSDRDVYEQLYNDTLHEASKDVPVDRVGFCSSDLVLDTDDARRDDLFGAQAEPLIDDETPIDQRWLDADTDGAGA